MSMNVLELVCGQLRGGLCGILEWATYLSITATWKRMVDGLYFTTFGGDVDDYVSHSVALLMPHRVVLS
jgi:hypothetical protein